MNPSDEAVGAGVQAILAAQRAHHASYLDHLARADLTGSSGHPPFCCDWDDHGEIFKQYGYLPRAKFGEFAERFLASPDDEPDVSDLIEPFDD